MWNTAMAQTGPLLSRVLSDFHWRSSATQVSPKNTQTGIPPRLISPAHRPPPPPPPPPQQRRSGGGLDWGKGQKGKREVSSAAWIRGWKKTCCWGKQFRRVYQQLLWEIAVSGAHVKPLAGGSFGGQTEALSRTGCRRDNRLDGRLSAQLLFSFPLNASPSWGCNRRAMGVAAVQANASLGLYNKKPVFFPVQEPLTAKMR